MQRFARFAALSVLLAATGCEIYFGGPGEVTPDAGYCLEGWAEGLPLRNPDTGQCDFFGGGPTGCEGVPYPTVPLPDWGWCYSTCESLDETNCRATADCRAVYGTWDGIRSFAACWPTAPSGPVNGWCGGLDAYECSRHDDCLALYDGGQKNSLGPWLFVACENEDPCPYLPTPGVPARLLRNPETGECQSIGSVGGCGGAMPPPEPDWGSCYSECESLDEATCAKTDGCRTTYQVTDYDDSFRFGGCWATAPSGPVRGGACAGLEAYECSRHDDCRAVYGGFTGGFVTCQDEEPCADDRPVALRNPETSACEVFSAGGCPWSEGAAIPAWGACASECNALGEDACRANDGCQAIYVDNCPPGADCFAYMPRFAACWAVSLGPKGDGACEGLDAFACSQRDNCTAEHERSYACDCDDGCVCSLGAFLACRGEEAPPPPPCADTFDEASCIANPTCEPIYEGHDCSCDDAGCTCGAWEFLACRDGDAPRTCGYLSADGGVATCAANEYCDYPDSGMCGEDDGGGICRPRPDVCPAVLSDPVCGCDGTTYASECEANRAGEDVDPGHYCAGIR